MTRPDQLDLTRMLQGIRAAASFEVQPAALLPLQIADPSEH